MPLADQSQAPVAESLTVYRLSRSHWHCSLANFNWNAVTPLTLRALVDAFLAETASGQSPHLVLFGKAGRGKTHIGVAVYRAIVLQVGTGLATWVNVPKFCEEVKASYGGDTADPFEEYQEARRLVVLDDLFGRDLSLHEGGQIVTRLIDTAYQNNAAMLVTMNQDPSELGDHLLAHEVSRILSGVTIARVQAPKDWRRPDAKPTND